MATFNDTFGVAFYLKKRKKNRDGKSPIVARVTFNGTRIEIATKCSTEETKWNVSKGLAKGTSHEATKLNIFLSKFRTRIEDSYQEMQLKAIRITLPLLKAVGKDITPNISIKTHLKCRYSIQSQLCFSTTSRNQ